MKIIVANMEQSVAHIADIQYGVNRSTLSGWVKQLSPIKVSEDETVTLKEFKALQKEMQRLKIPKDHLYGKLGVNNRLSAVNKMRILKKL